MNCSCCLSGFTEAYVLAFPQEAAQQEQQRPMPAPPGPGIPAADDTQTSWRFEELERQQRALQEERETLLQTVASLRAAIAKRSSAGKPPSMHTFPTKCYVVIVS